MDVNPLITRTIYALTFQIRFQSISISISLNLYFLREDERDKINCEKNGCSIGKERYLKKKKKERKKKKSIRPFESTSFPFVFFGPVKN